MEGTENKVEWYDKKWLVVLLCLCFFPVGLYALWKSKAFSKPFQIGMTVLVALILIAGLSGNGNKSKNTSNNEEPAKPELTQAEKDSVAKVELLAEIEERKQQTTSASDIVNVYAENEVKADNYYKDKTFYVEGTVEKIGKDITDDVYITLKSGNIIRSVQCMLNENAAKSAAELNKGDFVTIKGTCSGLMMNVLMKDCEFVESLSSLEKRAKGK
jgi:hypothetical protein